MIAVEQVRDMRGNLSLFPIALILAAWPAHSEDLYRFGAGDTIRVSVWRQPGFTTQSDVDSRGFVVVPKVGKVLAAGRTPEELSARIEQFLLDTKAAHPIVVHVESIRSRVQRPESPDSDARQIAQLAGAVLELLHDDAHAV